MDAKALIERLTTLPGTLEALLSGLSDADWRWRPPGGGWSILEVVNHLADEEVEDFRARASSTIEDPERPWAPIDPEGAVSSRGYQDRVPRESLARFRRERTASLAWLLGLAEAPWDRAHVHPRMGTMRAGDLLASWAAHDARHLGQVAKRLHALAIRDGEPYSVEYAG